MALTVQRIAVGPGLDYPAFRRATGEDLGRWSFRELGPGRHAMQVAEATRWCVLGGRARIASGPEAEQVGPGCVVRLEAGEVEWTVAEGLHARVQTEASLVRRDAFATLVERTGALEPATLAGRFEEARLAALAAWAPSSRVVLACVDEGPLFRAVFPLPGALQAVALKLARAAELNVLVDDAGTAAQRWLDLEREGGLGRAEELYVRVGERLLRWSPGSDEPVGDALRRLLALPGAAPGVDAALGEPLVEELLAALWGPGTPKFMFDYMAHPVDVPYPVENLVLSRPVALSPAFRERWGIRSLAFAQETLPVEARVEIDLPADLPGQGRDACAVRWTYGHEFAEWRVEVEWTPGGPRVVARELVAQYD